MSPKPDASTYPTPPHSVDSPRAGRSAAPTSSGDSITQYQSLGTLLSTGSPLVESHLPPTLEISRQRKFRCLQLCRFGEDGTQLLKETRFEQKILKPEGELLTQDPLSLLQPFLGRGEADSLPFLRALRLPVQWTGKEAAVTYYRMLEAVKLESLVLDRLAKRIAQILFHLNCTWLEKYGKLGKLGKTVASFILSACPEEPIEPRLRKSRLNNINTLHRRQGNRCWMLAACLGTGILLYGGDAIETIMNSNLHVAEFNAFICFVLRTRPGTVRLFHSFDPIVKAIMLGEAAVYLRPAILADSATRQEQRAHAYESDQEALTDQMTEEIWQALDAESIAKQRISEILPGF
ncbi:hypothetical protein BDV12DRAFT_191248 [Aspergillus spectabilis]